MAQTDERLGLWQRVKFWFCSPALRSLPLARWRKGSSP